MSRTFDALRKAENGYRMNLEERPPASAEAGRRRGATIDCEGLLDLKQSILCAADQAKQPRVLAFSASTRREGSSTVLVNFARTLASGGERVIAVDGNIRNPAFHELFGVAKNVGLAEVLQEGTDVRDALKTTWIENVSVLTVGTTALGVLGAGELKALEFLSEQLQTMAEWTLFDLPPVNASSDAPAIASKMDGVVLVILSDKTRREIVQSAVRRLEAAKAKVLGVVLNRRKMPIPGWIYNRL